MTLNSALLVVLSFLVAGGLSFFQYYYKAKNKSKLIVFLAFLRFASIFGILVLLINPVVTSETLEIVKPPLAVVVDNSSSIVALKAKEKTLEFYKALISNTDLQEKFDVQSYQFDSDFQPSNQFDFTGKQTNLDAIAKDLKSINKNGAFPTVVITDGNQTNGNDYVFSFDSKNKVFPVIVCDTTKILDFKITQLNVNKYAFYKNKFPVEVFLQYSGDKNALANLSISQGNTVLQKQSVSFSPSKQTAIVSLLLPANAIGTQVYKASIFSKEKEINTYNNSKNFAVEVIDQKTNVAIISSLNHPDIAALKRAIESNSQRKVTVVNPNKINYLSEYNILILYQPTTEFKKVFDDNKLAGINSFIITGTETDFAFLNQQQEDLDFKMSSQKEDYLGSFNSQFNLFATDDIGFENFPPLENAYGKVTVKGAVSVLLSSKIRNIATNAPLLAFVENQGKRSAYLLGENSWKWRMQSHVNSDSFDSYDLFIDKIIQFLASNNSKKSLVVNHESFYNSGDGIEISAQYFNKNYEFDEKARLSIAIENTKTKQTKNYDLLKSNASYKVNLDGLAAGNYNFKVTELNSKTTYSSQFEILEFDIEKQFVNPDMDKLVQLAQNTNGKLFYSDQVKKVTEVLLADETYQSIQKSNRTRSPLIDWYWMLVLIVIFLATEWFARKYNGLL